MSDEGYSLAMHIEPDESDWEVRKASLQPQQPLWILDKVEIDNGKVVSAFFNGVKFVPAKPKTKDKER